MGGIARRGVLFEGAAGHRQDVPGQGHGRRGRRAVPVRVGQRVPVDVLRPDQPQDPSFFKALRKAARAEGGAIGFIEEFDAIGGARTGMGPAGCARASPASSTSCWCRCRASTCRPVATSSRASWSTPSTCCCRRTSATAPAACDSRPTSWSWRPPTGPTTSTRRCCGRGASTASIHFDLPPRADRVAIADYYLATQGPRADGQRRQRRRHHRRLQPGAHRAPARRGADLRPAPRARVTGHRRRARGQAGHRARALPQDVGYQPEERRRIAMHEAGHAVWSPCSSVATSRVASILRRSALARPGGPRRQRGAPPAAHRRRSSDLHRTWRWPAWWPRSRSSARPQRASPSDLAAATDLAAQLVGAIGAGGSRSASRPPTMPTAGNLVAKVLADEQSRAAGRRASRSKAADQSACMLLEHRAALLGRRGCVVRTRRAHRRPRARDRRGSGQHLEPTHATKPEALPQRLGR